MKYMNDKEKIIEKEMLNAGKTKIAIVPCRLYVRV